MRIKTEIHEKYTSPEIHICNRELNPMIRKMYDELQVMYGDSIVGTDKREERCVLHLPDLLSFYALKQRVIARAVNGEEYTVSKKLYELETELESAGFIRISKSEIVNIRKIKRLDMSLTGTVKIIMANDYETYTSRRNVTKIKKILS